jgi:hypothetical protein
MEMAKRSSMFYQQYQIRYDSNSNQWKLTWDGNPIMSGTKEYLEYYLSLLSNNQNIMF